MCRKWIESEAALQQHLRICVNTGRKVMVLLQRLTDDQILACRFPQPQLEESRLHHECQLCGEHLRSAGLLKSHIDLHLTQNPCQFKCSFSKCAILFSSSCELKKHRRMHYQALKRMECDVCGKVSDRKSELKRHMQRHIKLRPFACNFPGCSYAAKFSFELQQHQKRAHTSILYSCWVCDENFKSNVQCKSHVAQHSSKMPGFFHCLRQGCQLLFKTGMDLIKHIKEMHDNDGQLQCNECGRYYVNKLQLRAHINWHCMFKCNAPRCSFWAQTEEDLQEHKRSEHTPHQFTCCYCGIRYKYIARFKRHLERHATDTPGVLKCLVADCTKTFTEAQELKKHVDTHDSENQYACQVCGKLFSSKFNLNKHKLQHKVDKIMCPVPFCKSSGSRLSKMHEHMKIEHIHDIQTTCQLCGQGFYSATQFKNHWFAHTRETIGVLKCLHEDCQEQFSVSADLREHLKQHNGINWCDVRGCIFSSYSPSHLQLHKTTVHASWPFHCQLCGKGFDWLQILQLHMKKHENGDLGAIECIKNQVKRRKFKKCRFCCVTFKSSSASLITHENKHKTETPGVIQCIHKGCQLLFISVADLTEHAVQHYGPSKSKEQSIACNCPECNYESKKLLDTLTCDIAECLFSCNVAFDMQTHQQTAHVQHIIQITCQLCGQGCFSDAQFKEHVQKHKTSTEGEIRCLDENCRETFSVLSEFRTHLKQHGDVHECDVAGCLFTSKSFMHLQFHKINVHAIWPHQCQLCGSGFEQSGDLQIHMKNHVTGSPAGPINECQFCGRILKCGSERLVAHVLKHKSEKLGVLKCVYKSCNALSFNLQADLRFHVDRVHPGNDDNGKTFESSDSLVKIHKTKKQPKDRRHYRHMYACQFAGCSSSFLLLEQLLEHTQSSHANSKDSKCMLCGKIVLQHALFWQHVAKHQTDKVGVVKCAYSTCNQTFTATIDLKEHVNRYHQFQLSASSSSIS
jgi:KRAB domain-containing zinc finger protein